MVDLQNPKQQLVGSLIHEFGVNLMILRVSYILLLRWFAGFCPSEKNTSGGSGAGFGKFVLAGITYSEDHPNY